MGIFVGSTMGDTMEAAGLIARQLRRKAGVSVPVLDIAGLDLTVMLEFDVLLIGCPTWDIGQLEASWRAQFDAFRALDLSGKLVSFFGAGDQVFYEDTYQDAMGILADAAEESGARLVGAWPAAGYLHTGSRGQRGDHFVGLALDFEHQIDLTEERVEAWTGKLLEELREGGHATFVGYAGQQQNE